MMNTTEAEALAKQYLIDLEGKIGTPLRLTKTQEESFGWVFFYQSKEYVETGNLSSMLAGNAPFIIDRVAGALYVLGTAHPTEVYIKEYEQRRGLGETPSCQ
jgi:Immunity protein 35